MKSKTVLGILLLLSIVFVLYPQVDALIKAQNAINELNKNYVNYYNSSLDAPRNNLVIEIVGFVLVYLFLAFGFNFIRFEKQETSIEPQKSEPIQSQQAIKPKTPKVVKPLTQNLIAVLSASVFMLVFVWQISSNVPNTASAPNFAATTFFLEQAFKGIIACLTVGIVAYIVAKYHSARATLGIICIVLTVGLVGTVANYTSIISGKDNTIATSTRAMEDLMRMICLGKSEIWINQQTVSQSANSYTYWNHSVGVHGYISVNVQASTTNNTYVRVIWSSPGWRGRMLINYDNQITVGTNGTANFPVLQTSGVEIRVGNTNLLDGATETVTITYYYAFQ